MRSIARILYIKYVLLKYTLQLHKPLGVRMRRACEDLGPIFVKFGQLLSTRADLLPDEVATELAKLQDQVPHFCGKRAQKIIEKTFNQPINELFLSFDTQPLASASIAQVHAATLHDNTSVVVKILRPNIKKYVMRDINIVLKLARLLPYIYPATKTFKPYEVILEIKKSLNDELDLMREAANASQLRRNFTNSHLLYVPAIYWSHTRKNIITMERIHGVPISHRMALEEKQTNLKRLAERGVEIFFTQVFRDCFFHADMHPGNVWVCIANPSNPKYLALDFGIMGTLSPADQYYLAENFLAFFNRDYRRIAKLHIESGWVPRNTRIDEFESAIRCVCEPNFAMPLKDISFGKTLLRLLQTARRFDMQIQPQLILLQKTLINIEGLGRQLYPDLDLWHTAKPFLEEWSRSRMQGSSLLRKLRADLPGLVYNTLQNFRQTPQNTAAIKQPVWYYFVLGFLSATVALLGLRIL